MSTKIYNGYKIRNISLMEQKEFVDYIKNKLFLNYEYHITKLYSIFAQSTIDDLCELNYEYSKTKDSSKIEKYLKKLYCEGFHSIAYHLNTFNKTKEEVSFSKIMEDFSYPYIGTIDEITKNYIENKGHIISVVQRNNPSFDFEDNLILFPLSNTEILLLVYGTHLSEIFETLVSSRKKNDVEFRKKFQLEYYFYQNSTEKPTNISKKDWEKRKQDWNTVLPSGAIPAHNGINIELFNVGTLMCKFDIFWIMKKYSKKLSKLIVSKENRVNKYSLKKAKENYILKKSNNDLTTSKYIEFASEWNDLYENQDKDVLLEVETLKEEYNSFILNLSLEDYQKTIMNFLPNFLQDKK